MSDERLLDLLIYAMEQEHSKKVKEGRVFKYSNLTVCHNCFHNYVIDYHVLVLTKQEGRCDFCGCTLLYPSFELLLAETNRRKIPK